MVANQAVETLLISVNMRVVSMSKYEKSDSVVEHSISSNQVLCCSETGRVIAVFYNDYDLDAVIDHDNDFGTMYAELTLTRNQLDNATAKLHGTRQHVTEVNQAKIQESDCDTSTSKNNVL